MRKKEKEYRIKTIAQAKSIAMEYLKQVELDKVIKFGLPEIDDRYDIYRVPLKSPNGDTIGEVVIDAITSLIELPKTTNKEILESRLLGRKNRNGQKKKRKVNGIPKLSTLRNTIGFGDSEELLTEIHSKK